jgi:selenocysteine-specific translation elongation factor
MKIDMLDGDRATMHHLAVGLFHDEMLGRELGKKGTESDMAMFNRKLDQHILTIMSPVADKLTVKSQIISNIDAAIVVFAGMTRELGETVVMLDSLRVRNGMAVTSPSVTPEQISAVTIATSLESYTLQQRDPIKINEVLQGYIPTRDASSPPLIIVDHSFSVRGVGEVILGFVRKGIVRKYDKLMLLPAKKEVIVRSIQMQDEDFDEAMAGARVGLAIKGATVDEMSRGSVLCAANTAKAETRLKLSFEKSRFYPDEVVKGAFHVTVGMQTVPITITEITGTSIAIESQKPIVYLPEDIFLLLDLNAKMRVMGKAGAQ